MAASIHLIYAASGGTSSAFGNIALQSVIGAILTGGFFASIASFRKAKPEAELTTLKGMQILMTRLETDNERLRGEIAEAHAEREAAEAHALYSERKLIDVETRLRRWDPNYGQRPSASQ